MAHGLVLGDMDGYLNGGNIHRDYIKDSIKNRTLKLVTTGNSLLYRKDIKYVLGKAKIADGEIECIYKERKSREWYAVLSNSDRLNHVIEHGPITVGDVTTKIEKLTQQKITLKIHWLPHYISDDFLVDFFSRYGTVEKVDDIWSPDAKCRTGLREVYMSTDDEMRNAIPHMVRFNNGISMLVTCPDRLPLCLKCHCLGHVRQECPNNNRPTNGMSYAAALRMTTDNTPPESSGPSREGRGVSRKY